MHQTRHGVTIIEVVVTFLVFMFVFFILFNVVFPPLGRRVNSRFMASQSNLRQLGIGNANFASNNDGLIVSYNSQGLGGPLDEIPRDALHLAQLREAEILRSATGRFDGDNAIRVDESVVPHFRSLHIPLVDFMTGQLPEPVAVSPMDDHLLDFQEHAERADYALLPGGDPSVSFDPWTREQAVARWAYASSYMSTVSAWSPDTPGEDGRLSVRPGPDSSTIEIDRERTIVDRRMDEVAFPSSKTFMFEEFDYTAGASTEAKHFADPDARVNVLFFDGSVRRILAADANPGWDPASPCDPDAASSVVYRPIDRRYFPRSSGTPRSEPFRWTRGGLSGVDVLADEVAPEWCDE